MKRLVLALCVVRVCHCVPALLVACIGFAAMTPALAQSAEDFFKGKTLRFTVVYEPGGTYDLYSRLLITHLPKHIPGNPTIVIQYMPGAGGMVGTVNLYEKAARDGTQLGMLPRDIAVNQMLHPEAARYDAKRFTWIGRIASYTGVMFVMSRTGVKTADDLRRKDVVVGSWGNTTDSFVTPTLLNALAGTHLKIVTGYRGAADVDLAIERGEADARVASWTALKTTRGEWLKDGRIAATGGMEVRLVRIEFCGSESKATWGRTGLAPNYKLLIENGYARIYDIRMAAGTSEPLHTHHDRVVVCLSGAQLRHVLPDGHTEDSSLKTGDCLWRLGQTHVGRNIGQTDLWVIAVEPK